MSCGVQYSRVASNAGASIVAWAKAGGVPDTSPKKQLRIFSLWETEPSLSLASSGPRNRGRGGRSIRLDRSRLRFPRL